MKQDTHRAFRISFAAVLSIKREHHVLFSTECGYIVNNNVDHPRSIWASAMLWKGDEATDDSIKYLKGSHQVFFAIKQEWEFAVVGLKTIMG